MAPQQTDHPETEPVSASSSQNYIPPEVDVGEIVHYFGGGTTCPSPAVVLRNDGPRPLIRCLNNGFQDYPMHVSDPRLKEIVDPREKPMWNYLPIMAKLRARLKHSYMVKDEGHPQLKK